MDSILETLETAEPKTLTPQFLSVLSPFSDFIALDPKPKNPRKKKRSQITPTSVRPLAKQFLPFLSKSLKLIPALLRRNPSSPSPIDGQRATELLKIYRLVLDCFSCISLCLVGNPNFVDIERGGLVYCLESWGKYEEAEEEGVLLMGRLEIGKREGLEPEIAMLAVKVVACLLGCACKQKSKVEEVYWRNLRFLEQVSQCIRVLDTEPMGKYHTLLVNALFRSALFLAGECVSFDSGLVREFCQKTLIECLKSSSMDRFQNISRNICKSIDKNWEDRSSLILDMLNIAIKGSLCECKAGMVKSVNEFLEFAAYVVRSLCSTSIDICKGASELLYKYGGDFLQVSPPLASIMLLYATGLYVKLCNAKVNDASLLMLFLENEQKLQRLTQALDALAKYFDISIDSNKVFFKSEVTESDLPSGVLESMENKASKHLHGNISMLSYLDALEYLCFLLVEYVNATWEYLASKDWAVSHSLNISYIQDALHQFSDFILVAFKCTGTSEREIERLHESRRTLLQVAITALKISLGVSANHKKSLSSFKSIISSSWIEPQELKYFISALGNLGASLYNTGQLKQASVALQLRCRTVWTHVKILCKLYTEKPQCRINDGLSEEEIKSVIIDAFEKCASIVDVLHKCHAANAHKIAVKSLIELCAGEDMFPNLSGSLALVKQWVKMSCKDFVDVDTMENAPYLYSFLLSRNSTWSKQTLGKILEQELLAYELMEGRNPGLCQKMQLKVIDTLLDDIFTADEYQLQRSRILVRKGRALRACGKEGLNECIKCLSDAISLLKDTSVNPANNATTYNQLALIYILAAQCTQEASQDCEVILQNVRNALEIWSSIDFQGLSSENGHMEMPATNTVQLLCCIVDLLSMMGCWELQFGIFKLIIMFLKYENVPTGECLAMLWNGRRINHSLCTYPINYDAIMHMSQHLGNHADSVEFWITCLKEYPSSLLAFFQKLSLSDSILPEITSYRCEKYFGTASVDEVKMVASALISEVPLSSQSATIAGHLYYDLSERLLSGGRLFDALSHARVALWLRRKMLQRKFIYSFEQSFAKPGADATKNRHDDSRLEIIGSVATELWPGISRPGDLDNSIITPWSVLRCYLESILQVGIINESIGNGAEAEVLFLTGRRISLLQNLPIFQIAFTSLLGKLYCKNQLWDLAEDELNSARNLLLENDMVISCKCCKLAFDVFIDMQFGDISRDRPEKFSSSTFSSDALQLYRKALDKLGQNKSDISDFCSMADTVNTLLDKNNMQGAQNEVLSTCRRSSTSTDIRLLECNICSSLNRNVHHAKQLNMESMEAKESNLHKVTKKGSRILSKCLQKEHDMNADLKPKTRLSNRTSRNKSSSATDRADNNEAIFADDDNCSDILSLRKSRVKINGNSSIGVGCKEEPTSSNLKCWRCLLIKVMVEGNMRNIIHLKWENHHRRLVLILLLKIAKYKGRCCRKNKLHEVHDEFWQCISVMFTQYPISHSSSEVSESCLTELTRGEDLRYIFPLERAAILYNLSRFILKDCYSEHSRMKCCTLANIQMPDVVPWLLKAFILSRELPLLFQKVSKLLASILLISTVDGSVSIPFSTDGLLSISHWAAYFHQASLGTYLPSQYLACLKDKACYPKVSVDPCAAVLDTAIKASNFLRFAPERVEHLEDFVREFFQSLPSVPIICLSLLEGDYADLIGETLLLPSFLPAWMLLSRLKAGSQAISMLLPVDRISEDVQFESMKEWQCPWAYSVIDYVAPGFKHLLKENFLSSNMTCTSADTKINNVNWWSQRSNLNNALYNLLRSMEELWLGPWTCLLLGEYSDLDYLSTVVTKVIKEMKHHYKVDANDMLVSAILGGSKSTVDAEACISQLILYKGYFGRGGCCGEERLRAFSSGCLEETRSMPESVYKLILETTVEITEQADREPVILVLDSDVQMLPWESLPTLRKQEVYRMPSVGSVSLTLRRCSYYQKQNKAFGAGFPLVNPLDSYYLLNPSGDLDSTQVEFEQWFRNQNWEGEAGKVPTAKELVLALQNHDLFLYFGHGSGMQYIPGKEIHKLEKCAAMLLMGCSSGSLTYRGSYAPRGAPLSYLFAGSPAVIANLWEVTDKDIDRFGKAMLKSWLQEEPLSALENCTRCNQLVKEFGCLEIDEGRKATIPKSRRKAIKSKKLQHCADKGRCKICGAKRIASFMSEARDACKLPFLIGASPVCYGVPTVVLKKS